MSPEDPKLSWLYATKIYQYLNYYPLQDKHCSSRLLPNNTFWLLTNDRLTDMMLGREADLEEPDSVEVVEG
jgi:hypothetical protein